MPYSPYSPSNPVTEIYNALAYLEREINDKDDRIDNLEADILDLNNTITDLQSKLDAQDA